MADNEVTTQGPPTLPGGLPPSAVVIAAIIRAKKAIGTIAKDETNPFHRYKYVPIDAYYEHVASKAAEAGLTWRTNLVDLKVFSEGVDDRGRPTSILSFTFSVDLMHDSGGVYEGWQVLTILHPVQGAQTTGSAMSYAEKLFMRTTFSVVTAEDDVDAKDSNFQTAKAPPPRPGPPRVMPPPPRPVAPPLPPAPLGEHDNHPALSDVAREFVLGMDPDINAPVLAPAETIGENWDVAAEIMQQFTALCETPEALSKFWLNNLTVMKRMETADPARYATTLDKFKAKKAALTATKET